MLFRSNNPTYHIGLGTALSQERQWIGGLEQFVAFDPPSKDREMVLRQERLNIKQIEDQLKQGNNFDAQGWLAIGIYYAKIGRNKEAEEAFQKSVQLNPRQVDAWFNLASLSEADKDWTVARMAYQRLLDLHEGSVFQKDFARQHLKGIKDR